MGKLLERGNKTDNEMESIKYNDKNGRYIALLLTMLLIVPQLNYYLNGVGQQLFGWKSISMYFYLPLLLCTFKAYSLLPSLSNSIIRNITFITLVLSGIAYVIYPEIRTALIVSDYNPAYSQLLQLVLFGLPALLLVAENKRWDLVLKYSAYASIVMIPLSFLTYYASAKTIELVHIDYMPISYNVLTAVCICNTYGILKKNPLLVIESFVGFLFILVVGARGALLCAILYYVIFYYRHFKNNGKNNRIVILILLLCLFGLFYVVMEKVTNSITSGSLYSRNLSFMSGTDFFTMDDRAEIQDAIKSAIEEFPLGYGLFGDRYAMVKGGLPPSYSHNILIEIVCDFGVILGPLMILYLLMRIFKVLRKKNSIPELEVFICVLPIGFFKLFMSDSFIMDVGFWIILGIILGNRLLYNNSEYEYSNSSSSL